MQLSAVMSHQLTEAKMAEFMSAFQVYENGDGTIATRELGNAMRFLGLHPMEAWLQDTINDLDANVDWLVFCRAAVHLLEETEKENLRQYKAAFAELADASETIDVGQLNTLMNALGQNKKEAELQDMIGEGDPHNLGIVALLSFLAFMMGKTGLDVWRFELNFWAEESGRVRV